jgi:hypothetical protein
MFGFTEKRRENTVKALLTLLAVDCATLVFGREFNLKMFIIGCIIAVGVYVVILLIEED